MYQPKHFIENDVAALQSLIRAAPLATLVLNTPQGLLANHIPFVLQVAADDSMKLLAHIPRANPLSEAVSPNQECLAIFHGPQGYMSPSYYVTKQEHGRVVPTWNYSVVHAHGTIRVIDDSQWIRQQMDMLTALNESPRLQPWAVADAPADFVDSLLKVLVGLEFSVTRLEGKKKLGQNQPARNQRSMLDALSREAPDAPLTRAIRDELGEP